VFYFLFFVCGTALALAFAFAFGIASLSEITKGERLNLRLFDWSSRHQDILRLQKPLRNLLQVMKNQVFRF
jgi:hypothetical protein